MALQDHGILQNGEQPAISPDGRLRLLLDGEIYNGDELRIRYRDELGSVELSDPQLCLRLIERHGAQIAHEFNGLFAISVWDATARRLQLISDHFGFRPLFYTHRDGEIIFGTELKALRAADPHKAQADDVGIFELFCYGSHVFGQTWLKNYRRLKPASILTIEPSGITERTYWSYGYDESAKPLDQPTYYTLFGTLLDRAVERCMKGKSRVGIFLSGGYDSRAVAASIRKHHLPVAAFTFGYEESRDVRFAKMLAARLGLAHQALTSREPYLYRFCRPIVWRTEGLLPFASTTSPRFHAPIKSHIDIFLTGFLGEFGGSHTWPRLVMATSRRQAVAVIKRRIFEPQLAVLRRIFSRSFYERAKEAAEARFHQSFDVIKDEHALNVADSWNLMHLQPMRTYQSASVDRHILEARAPQMDFELVEFLLTIPPQARLEQRIYKKMIAYRFPQIRDIPCTNSGLPINPAFLSEYTKMVLRYAGRKSAGALRRFWSGHEPLGRRPDNPAEELRNEPALIDDILRPAMFAGVLPSDTFDHGGLNAIIDEHYARRADHTQLLSCLISHATAREFFLHDELKHAPEPLEHRGKEAATLA